MDEHKYFVKKLIKKLEGFRGRHTELVTVYIPAGFSIDIITNQIFQERSTATNIKSRTTRQNVLAALDKLSHELKKYKNTFPNGMAVFCGNVSEEEGKPDIQIWIIEPPEANKVRLYRCDQEFILDPLKDMITDKKVYGLIAMDHKDACIAILSGNRPKILRNMESAVPGKTRAGGQCLSPDTLIMKDNGEIIEIKDCHNPLLIVSENLNSEKTEETPIIRKWENSKEIYKIITCYPKIEIKASADHTFFVRTEGGIEEKPLNEIKEGGYLIMPEKINLVLQEQQISFRPKIKQAFNTKKVSIPNTVTPLLGQILGYYLGDGNYEIDRIGFSEQREDIAEYYKMRIKDCFGLEARIRYRKTKNYYQIRVGSRILAQFFKDIFNDNKKTLNAEIPGIILRSPDNVVSSFIGGLFDAEGYVSKSRVALSTNNKKLIRELQFSLLRLGIISSVNEYDNRKNPYSKKIRYTLAIDDIKSIKKFREVIGFRAQEKKSKVDSLINNRSNRNKVRQICVNGREVARIIRNSGISTHGFGCPDFFNNKKQLSKEIFKSRILEKITNPELRRRLEQFYLSNLIVAKIAKISREEEISTVDIETKNHNFLANGLIVHNSSQRFQRVRSGIIKQWYIKVADAAFEIFKDYELQGIVVGGPGPAKEDLIKNPSFDPLNKKLLGVVHIGYGGEDGISELIFRSKDLMKESEIYVEKENLAKFFSHLARETGLATYGLLEVKSAIQMGAVEKVIVSEAIEEEVFNEINNLCEKQKITVNIYSIETEEGEHFFKMGGIGAFLKYKVY